MEKKLHTFFQSGLLDKYILDETSASESLKVEHFIDTYPEVESEYKRLRCTAGDFCQGLEKRKKIRSQKS